MARKDKMLFFLMVRKMEIYSVSEMYTLLY